MTERQRRREAKRRRRKIRRLKRRLKAYLMRAFVTAAVLLLCVGIVRGGMAVFGRAEKASEAFQGARILENEEKEPAGSPLIVLDAGHGGRDQGTSSGRALEKEINLEVAKKLARELERAGAAVLLTREDDTKVGLEARAEFANQNDAELFVSLHCNYCEDDAGVKGLECYYRDGSSEGQELADSIVAQLESDSEISCRGTRIGDFRVLNKTDMPAVLVEMGYLSNRGECGKLTDDAYQEQLVKRLAEGILAVPSSAP